MGGEKGAGECGGFAKYKQRVETAPWASEDGYWEFEFSYD
jgi:hypothetical protein